MCVTCHTPICRRCIYGTLLSDSSKVYCTKQCAGPALTSNAHPRNPLYANPKFEAVKGLGLFAVVTVSKPPAYRPSMDLRAVLQIKCPCGNVESKEVAISYMSDGYFLFDMCYGSLEITTDSRHHRIYIKEYRRGVDTGGISTVVLPVQF